MISHSELEQHPTSWEPKDAQVTLNISIDAAFVPSSSLGTRLDQAHLVVLDNFLSAPDCQELLEWLTAPKGNGASPPIEKWERETCDAANQPTTWGLKDSLLTAFATCSLRSKLELQSRLNKLYPDCIITHMPSHDMQPWRQPQSQQDCTTTNTRACPSSEFSSHGAVAKSTTRAQLSCNDDGGPSNVSSTTTQRCSDNMYPAKVDANPFVANAAVFGDQFQWHVDADPSDLAPSAWTEHHGHYFNREPGKPLLFSLLLYLDASWPRHHDAETLFLDTSTDTGVLVRPKPGRAVLMDQDILHRLSAPSLAAGRPRYSLVFKLVMLPRYSDQACCLAKPEWGRPTAFGSAAKAETLVRNAARKRKLDESKRDSDEKAITSTLQVDHRT
ncbi:hypothetical protein CEUSTIGMA_g12860.t1 [Chlamydomonas eustigma]|uniref:Fe2OG dioxygenase domain-containing protein n=1 Tax=Chlamydomonas eustigma TaxID=1157962 RepID=A0A250XQV7_9CHLO|nr:hypothetical protein CEUSTIGMA_g12860.t1 [Chlamydomonas eustigma]|eukprot:GAX85444.1 hypothetical protein CEUSTIGMA_g12860.t1 [Chlamydomonas eustigma]